MTAPQVEIDFDVAEAGRSDVLTHLGASTVESVQNIIRVVASMQPTFSWNDVEPLLPDGIRQQLELVAFQNAPGAIMRNYAVQYGYTDVGRETSTRKRARGRKITLWGRSKP